MQQCKEDEKPNALEPIGANSTTAASTLPSTSKEQDSVRIESPSVSAPARVSKKRKKANSSTTDTNLSSALETAAAGFNTYIEKRNKTNEESVFADYLGHQLAKITCPIERVRVREELLTVMLNAERRAAEKKTKQYEDASTSIENEHFVI